MPPSALARLDDLGEPCLALHDPLGQHPTHLGVAAGRHERLEQQRRAGRALDRRLDEHRPGREEDVLHPALEVVVGEERFELVAGVRVDRLDEQLGLAGIAAVDGAGGDPGPASDLGDAGLVVAPLGEHLGCGSEQSVADLVGVSGRVDSGSRRYPRSASRLAIITTIIRPRQRVASGCRSSGTGAGFRSLEGCRVRATGAAAW